MVACLKARSQHRMNHHYQRENVPENVRQKIKQTQWLHWNNTLNKYEENMQNLIGTLGYLTYHIIINHSYRSINRPVHQ